MVKHVGANIKEDEMRIIGETNDSFVLISKKDEINFHKGKYVICKNNYNSYKKSIYFKTNWNGRKYWN